MTVIKRLTSHACHITHHYPLHTTSIRSISLSNRIFHRPSTELQYCQKRHHLHHDLLQHHHDLLEEKNRDLAAQCETVTKMALFSNIGLVVLKGTAGFITNSMSLMADAIHSLTDLLSDAMTFITIRYSQRKPTQRFPLGFGKMDTFGTLPIAGLLTIGSYHIIKASACKLLYLGAPATIIVMPHVAMGCLLLSLFVKEWLYRITIKAGNEFESKVTIANAWHHRSDAYSSLIALIGVGGYCCGYPIFDPICGMFVGFYLFKIGVDFFKIGFEQLLDRNSDIHWNIVNEVISKCDDVQELHELIVTQSGPYLRINAQIMVKPLLNMEQVQSIVNNVKVKLHENPALNIQYLAIAPMPYHVHHDGDESMAHLKVC